MLLLFGRYTAPRTEPISWKWTERITGRILTGTEGIEPVLAERWADYQRLRAAGAAYSALVRLGEIGNVLDHKDGHDPAVQKWKLTVGEGQIPDAMRGAPMAEAINAVDLLHGMV